MDKVIIGVIVILVIIGGFFLLNFNDVDEAPNVNLDTETTNWRDIRVKNINSQELFKISDFPNEIVLVESFAVWCPTCTRQQKITKEFKKEFPDVISISLDTDPNEDEARVMEHITRNGFDWYYAIAPVEMTLSLIDEFGTGIVNAPSVPMILICNGEARKLSNGIKDIDELKDEIAKC